MLSSFSDETAWRRTRRLAGQRGVDLARGVVDGWLRRDEVAGLVAVCGTCGKTAPFAVATAEAAPAGTCPNLPLLDALRP
jgi:hypothetical protein